MNLLLPYKTFKFTLIPKETILLPSYKGSTFRGGFGNAFKRVVCITNTRECSDCILKEKCVYSYVFETFRPSHSTVMKRYEKAPHPFIIEPPLENRRAYTPGMELSFYLTLIGKAIDYLPYFIFAFDELGKKGIGKGRGKYKLKEVESDEVIYSSDTKLLNTFMTDTVNIELDISKIKIDERSTVTIEFITPTRIVYRGELTFKLEFHILLRSLLRRIALVYYFHCSGNSSVIDFKGLIELAKNITVLEKNLQWYDWERYSKRQDTRMKLGGFVGSIKFQGQLSSFMSLLKAGEIIHVGKGTGFGLGKYKVKEDCQVPATV